MDDLSLTREAWNEKLREHDKMQKENWRKHFAKRPEQRLPGAKVERMIPNEESSLLAKIIGGSPEGPDEGEWTEVVDF